MARRILSSALLLPALLGAQETEVRTTARDRRALAVTVYADDRALVQDTRRVTLPKGTCSVAFEDVSDSIEPASVKFAWDEAGPLQILERSFDFDLVTPARVFERSLGSTVLLRPPGREGLTEFGRLIGAPEAVRTEPHLRFRELPWRRHFDPARPRADGLVVETPEGIEALQATEVFLTRRPDSLRSRPTLLQTLISPSQATRTVDLAYLTEGLTWQATYRATVSTDGRSLDLTAFMTVMNQTDSRFQDTSLQFVAGELNRAVDPNLSDYSGLATAATTVDVVASAATFRSEPLAEYMLWSLEQPTTLAPRQEKQLFLFQVEGIPFQVTHRASVWLDELDQQPGKARSGTASLMGKFENRKGGPLARPLPQGEVYLSQGPLLLSVPRRAVPYADYNQLPGAPVVIENTPVGETIEWELGEDPSLATTVTCIRNVEGPSPQGPRRAALPETLAFLQAHLQFAGPLPSVRMPAAEPDRPRRLTFEIKAQNRSAKGFRPELCISIPEEWRLQSCSERTRKLNASEISVAPFLPPGAVRTLRLIVIKP
jgi:hypothetical protein